jgi:Xaa-Pro aminopeptidase
LHAAIVGWVGAGCQARPTIAISAEACTNPAVMGVQKDRLAEAVRYLGSESLDGVVAVNYGHNSFLESHAVFVLSGVRPVGESAVVVDRAGASTLIVTPAWDAERAAKISHTSKTVGTDDLAATLASVLAEHRLDGRAIVSVGLATLAQGLAKRIEAALGGNSRANELFIRQLARIRSPEELAASEKATAIAEQGYAHMLNCVRPGMHEYELAAELYCEMKRLGAEDNFLLLSAISRCAPPASACSTPVTSSSPRSRPATRASLRRSAAPP